MYSNFEEEEMYFEQLSYDELLRTIEVLLSENQELKYKLRKVEGEYSDFIREIANASSNTTNAWVSAILSGELKV